MNEETIRKEFEEWADSEGFQLSSYTDSDGTKYACDHTQTAWWSWLESARRADTRARELEDRLFALGAMDEPPCFCCGYNGPGYYQPNVHKCAERHHRLAKEE